MISLSHALKYAVGMLVLVLCLPLSGLAQQATSNSMTKAPTTSEYTTLKVLKGGQITSATPNTETRMVIENLVAEMTANQNNPAYDMALSLKRLQKSPYVVYPLDHFDPTFPMVWRTGDVAQDRILRDEALAAWKANQ